VVGSVRIVDFTLADADRVMERLPQELAPQTRRHVANNLNHMLNLAVHPCRVIERNPPPKGFAPKLGGLKALSFLYPDEDALLLAHTDVPLCYRVLYGVLAREGLRLGEAASLTWSDIDLKRGAIRLDTNKTADSRTWALDSSVLRALAIWRERFRKGAPERAPVFVDPDGRPFRSDFHNAERFRTYLRGACVARPELYESSDVRQPIRIHDLRATFVTIAPANDRTESWVMDRTGHKSSQMLQRYRRAVRTVRELNLGPLKPLDDAIPELRKGSEKAVRLTLVR
jgi:integrase